MMNTQSGAPQNMPASLNIQSVKSSVNTALTGLSSKTWLMAACIGAIFAFICYFLPLQVIKINNPAQWLVGGADQFIFSSNAWQILWMKAPTTGGLGGLGEMAETMYDEINMGKLMFENGTFAIKMSIIIGRLCMLVLLGMVVTGLVLAYKAITKPSKTISTAMFVLGICGFVFLVISSFITKAPMKSDASDLEYILSAMFEVNNGFGFWGMALGFIIQSIGGYWSKK